MRLGCSNSERTVGKSRKDGLVSILYEWSKSSEFAAQLDSFYFFCCFFGGNIPTSIVINNFDFRVTSTAIETCTDIRWVINHVEGVCLARAGLIAIELVTIEHTCNYKQIFELLLEREVNSFGNVYKNRHNGYECYYSELNFFVGESHSSHLYLDCCPFGQRSRGSYPQLPSQSVNQKRED